MAELTTKKRKNLPDSAFALPGRRFPIHDQAHARAALSRASQFASPSEQAIIKRKVKKKFPGIEVGSGKLSRLGQATLGKLQQRHGDAEGKKRFHAQVEAGHLDKRRMFVGGGQ